MSRIPSILLFLIVVLCTALVDAITVYVHDYNYDNTIGGVTQERYRMSVTIGNYRGSIDGHKIATRGQHCSDDEMSRIPSLLLFLIVVLCTALVDATTVYVRYYDYENTIGGVTQETFRMDVTIASYSGSVHGTKIASKGKHCSKDGTFCVEAAAADCNYKHQFTFYYANRQKTIDMGEKPDCDFWPKDFMCKVCNSGTLTFVGKDFTFEF
ncbi:hypothetical protein BG004_007178 [Podila humilis]|nr:hypothetical protein BG004_007178 [Podila humilis]